MGNSKKSYYVVLKGRKPGIYTSWADCSNQVTGYSGCIFKGFSDFVEAEKYFENSKIVCGSDDGDVVSIHESSSASHGRCSVGECHVDYKDPLVENKNVVSITKVPDEPFFEYDAKNDMLHFPSEDHLFAYLGIGPISIRSNAVRELDFHRSSSDVSTSPKPIPTMVFDPWMAETLASKTSSVSFPHHFLME